VLAGIGIAGRGVSVRICSGPGCLRAVLEDVRFCDECKPTPKTTDDIREHSLTDRERYASLYSGPRWQRVRRLVVQRSPLCQRCELSITEIVDHIVPAGIAIIQARDSGRYLTDRYAGFYFLSNLQGLCRPVHHLKTIEDKAHAGPWPNVIEREGLAPKKRWSFS
jgi:5-methylcytosine-specific restriction endonuclease McrA